MRDTPADDDGDHTVYTQVFDAFTKELLTALGVDVGFGSYHNESGVPNAQGLFSVDLVYSQQTRETTANFANVKELENALRDVLGLLYSKTRAVRKKPNRDSLASVFNLHADLEDPDLTLGQNTRITVVLPGPGGGLEQFQEALPGVIAAGKGDPPPPPPIVPPDPASDPFASAREILQRLFQAAGQDVVQPYALVDDGNGHALVTLAETAQTLARVGTATRVLNATRFPQPGIWFNDVEEDSGQAQLRIPTGPAGDDVLRTLRDPSLFQAIKTLAQYNAAPSPGGG